MASGWQAARRLRGFGGGAGCALALVVAAVPAAQARLPGGDEARQAVSRAELVAAAPRVQPARADAQTAAPPSGDSDADKGRKSSDRTKVSGYYLTDKDVAPVEPLPGGLPDFAALARHAQPAVVSIVATPREQGETPDSPSAREFFERFYGAVEPPTKGMASGFVIRSDGYILTNGHVVEDAADIAVTLGSSDSHAYPAQVVGRDDLSDVALIKIDAGRPLEALALGDSDKLEVGDWVSAIGNPFGLSHSVTVGVVSFKGRTDVNPSGRPGYYDFIQTDASINPGNSGGPLMDARGRVVGISAAVNASGQGIGFAIPINMAKDILPTLFGSGAVSRSFLGVSIQDLSPELQESFGVPEGGVVVTELAPGGPARKVGLKVGDVITSFNDEPIKASHRLRWLASSAGPGSKAQIGYSREGHAHKVEVVLAALPQRQSKPAFKREPAPRPLAELAPLGFAVSGQIAAVSGGKGLRITKVDPVSPAYVAGLREGDVVLGAGDAPVRAPRDLQTLAGATRGKVLRLYIQRGLKPMFVGYRVP